MLKNIFGSSGPAEDKEVRPGEAGPTETLLAEGVEKMENLDNVFSQALADLKRETHFLYQSIVALSDHHAKVDGKPAAARDCRDCVIFRVAWHVPFEEASEAQKLINRDEATFEQAVRRARSAQG